MSWSIFKALLYLLFFIFSVSSLLTGIVSRKSKHKYWRKIFLVSGFLTLQVGIIGIITPFIIHVFLNSESHFAPYPEIDTKFAKDFTKEGFEKVQVGMTQGEVKQLIGEPLSTVLAVGNDRDCWQYSSDGKAGPDADFSYYMYLICFDGEKVNSKPVHEFYD